MRAKLTANKTQLAFVTMAEERQAKEFFNSYEVGDLPRFSDSRKELYAAFGLTRGNLTQMFGWKNFRRGFAAIRHGIGLPVGDVWQMPGAFVIYKGEIRAAFIHETASDTPDYEKMVCQIN